MNTRKLRGSAASLLGGLLLLATAPAHAQGTIVYHNPPDIPVLSTEVFPTRHDLDLDGNGTTDFTFEAFTSFRTYSDAGNRSVGVPVGGQDVGSWSIPLLDGFLIGPELPEPLQWAGSFQPIFPPDYWVGQTLHSRNFAGSAGYWDPPWPEYLRAYVGVEFTIEEATHYGWIQVEVFAAPGNGGTILDWAFNSVPGQPLLAGQVPEPGTWALLSVGIALFGWRTWRGGQRD